VVSAGPASLARRAHGRVHGAHPRDRLLRPASGPGNLCRRVAGRAHHRGARGSPGRHRPARPATSRREVARPTSEEPGIHHGIHRQVH